MSSLTTFLPTVLQGKGGYKEPSVEELGKKTRARLDRLEQRRADLESAGDIASGDSVAILASGFNGYGRFSERETKEHLLAAENIARMLKSIGIVQVELVPGATLEDMLTVLRDPKISDVMFVGHAERSNAIFDKTATWRIAEQTDHLKHSIGLIGCSTSYEGTMSPRFGTLLVPASGVLYGKQEGVAHPSEQRDLGSFHVLDHHMTDQNIPSAQQAA